MFLLGNRRQRASSLARIALWLPLVFVAGAMLAAQGGLVKSGTLVWHVAGEGQGTPVADEASVYFLAKNHEVVAIDRISGHVQWRATTGGSALLGLGALLRVRELLIAGDYDLLALDRKSGRRVWHFAPSQGYGPGIYLGGTAHGLVHTGSPAGRIYAISDQDGRLRWSFEVSDTGNTTVFEPTPAGDLVFAGYTTFSAPQAGGVIALDAGTGRQRWRTPFPNAGATPVSRGFAGGPLLVDHLVISASSEGAIYALDQKTGAIQWTLPPLSGTTMVGQDFRALALSGRSIIAGSLSGVIVSHDLQTRQERWRVSSAKEGSVGFRIVADRDSVYVPYVSGCLIAIDTANGAERWRIDDRNNRVHGSPFPYGEHVFASGRSGFFSFYR